MSGSKKANNKNLASFRGRFIKPPAAPVDSLLVPAKKFHPGGHFPLPECETLPYFRWPIGMVGVCRIDDQSPATARVDIVVVEVRANALRGFVQSVVQDSFGE